MAVTQVIKQEKKRNNTLGTLGTLASLGGAITGQPWLSALGIGMSGANAMMNGDASSGTIDKTAGSINEVLSGLKGIWTNPADNNIAKTPEKATQDKARAALGMTDEELAKKWGNLPPIGSNWGNGLGSGWQPNGSYVLY